MVLNKEKFIRLRLRGNSRGKDELVVAELETKKTAALFTLDHWTCPRP